MLRPRWSVPDTARQKSFTAKRTGTTSTPNSQPARKGAKHAYRSVFLPPPHPVATLRAVLRGTALRMDIPALREPHPVARHSSLVLFRLRRTLSKMRYGTYTNSSTAYAQTTGAARMAADHHQPIYLLPNPDPQNQEAREARPCTPLQDGRYREWREQDAFRFFGKRHLWKEAVQSSLKSMANGGWRMADGEWRKGEPEGPSKPSQMKLPWRASPFPFPIPHYSLASLITSFIAKTMRRSR
jgi:hypothetical protein